MQPTIAELMAGLPETPEHEEHVAQGELLHVLTEKLSRRPVPIGSLKRLSLLGTLQAKVAVAYFFHWLRGWFGDKQDKKRLSETHLRAAVQTLDSMSYLRGAVMKIGQTLANFPNLVPQELAETLGTLHFEAPPMHYSLIREQLHDELGGDPEDVWHAGNFLFMDDGKLGVVDFGCLHEFSDEEWELMRISDRALTTGRREDRLDFIKRWTASDENRGEDFWRVADEYTSWSWGQKGVYDFGDEEEFLRGARLFGEFVRKRYTRGQPCTPMIGRWEFGYRGLLLRLRARVPVRQIAEEEVVATGWRRDYA